MPATGRKTPADKDTARELVLFIENDGQLYRQMYQPIILNFAKKVVKRTFNRQLAIKGVVNLVNEGIVRYRREFGLAPVNQSTKELAARTILSGMTEEIRATVSALKVTSTPAKHLKVGDIIHYHTGGTSIVRYVKKMSPEIISVMVEPRTGRDTGNAFIKQYRTDQIVTVEKKRR